MHTLAYLYTTQGKYEEATILYQNAFAILMQSFGMVHHRCPPSLILSMDITYSALPNAGSSIGRSEP